MVCNVCVCVRERVSNRGVCDVLAEERQGDAAVLACAAYYICRPTNSDSLRQTMNISLRVYGVIELTVLHCNAAEIPEKNGKVEATAQWVVHNTCSVNPQ